MEIHLTVGIIPPTGSGTARQDSTDVGAPCRDAADTSELSHRYRCRCRSTNDTSAQLACKTSHSV